MSAKVYVEELSEADVVQSTFLVTQKSVRPSRTGEPFLQLTLTDRTGRIEARAWVDPQMLAERVDVDDFVAVRGEVTKYGDALQVEIADLDRVSDASVNIADYFPTSQWSEDALWGQLQQVFEDIRSEPIRAFVDALFDDPEIARRFRTAPAAMSNHHAYRGGLIEHCLSMCRSALKLAEHYDLYYPGLINRDLLVAGVILHDFAKVWELSYRRAFDYTTPGRLVGHIPMGAELVGRVAARSARPISEDLQMHLKHLVLAHHGELEYGSPIKPATAEAMLLHQVDMIDSRMNMLWNEHEKVFTEDAAESWTEYRRNLGGRILFRGRNSSDWEPKPRFRRSDLKGPGALKASVADPGDHNLNLFDDET